MTPAELAARIREWSKGDTPEGLPVEFGEQVAVYLDELQGYRATITMHTCCPMDAKRLLQLHKQDEELERLRAEYNGRLTSSSGSSKVCPYCGALAGSAVCQKMHP